jgi:hypothetical protein
MSLLKDLFLKALTISLHRAKTVKEQAKMLMVLFIFTWFLNVL